MTPRGERSPLLLLCLRNRIPIAQPCSQHRAPRHSSIKRAATQARHDRRITSVSLLISSVLAADSSHRPVHPQGCDPDHPRARRPSPAGRSARRSARDRTFKQKNSPSPRRRAGLSFLLPPSSSPSAAGPLPTSAASVPLCCASACVP